MKTPKQLKKKTNVKRTITVKIVIGVVVLLIVFGVLAGIIGYNRFSEQFTKEYSDNAVRIAETGASYVDANSLDEYLKEDVSKDEIYQASYALLSNLCDKVKATFIYVIQPDEDYEHITFVFNIVETGSGYEPYECGYVRDTTNDDYKEKYRRLYEGETEDEVVVRDQGVVDTGAHITAMVSLKDDNGDVKGILCVQRQMDALITARVNYVRRMIEATMLLIVLGTIVFVWFLNRSMIRPLRVIVNETQRFSEEPSPAETKLSQVITANNEMGQLADSIDRMEEETLQHIDYLTKVTAEQHRISTELEVAATIQQNMLNSVSPNRPELDIAATMIPAKEVGGDFYDFFMIDDDHLAIVIADVSGKGIPAAMFMAISKVIITDSTMFSKSPAEILSVVNERICKNNKLDMFVTVWMGILEISTGTVTAANAGHEYPAIYRSGKSFELMRDKHGFVVGGMSGMKYKEYSFTLKPGDSIFLYTDGVAEATDKDDQLFGSERIITALNIAPDGSPKEIMDCVKSEVDRFVGDAPQFDDLTMMCLKYFGKKED